MRKPQPTQPQPDRFEALLAQYLQQMAQQVPQLVTYALANGPKPMN